MAATAPPTERGLVASAADPEITAAIQIYDRLDPLRNALGLADLTAPEMQLFAMVAHRTGLDPFTKQIYAIKRDGKVSHQTGIDGYRSVAERTGQYLGSDEATYEECPCEEKPKGHPAVARVVVHRAHPSGHVVDQVGVARWHELKPPAGNSGRGDSMWVKMPFNQLSKCAEANGLRKAFPRVLGDVYIAEEMEQAGPPQDPGLAAAAAQPTASERLAARRAAIEQPAATVIEPAPEQPADWTGAPAEEPVEGELVNLVELLRDTASASSLEGAATEPQKAKLGELIGQSSPLDWAAESIPVLQTAFGEGFGPGAMTAAQAQAVINVAASLGEAFVDAWRAAAQEGAA